MKNKQAGFTLIEVVAVAALLGVLVTMIMPSLDGANTKVKNAKLRNDLAAVDQAIQLYKMENGSVPTNLEALQTEYIAGNSVFLFISASISYLLKSNYLFFLFNRSSNNLI